ncbi:MAG: pilus assembly protein [Methyloceanibacter sp.]|nr:pilus assembly protein [Methyloceanibacter sp.]
MLKSSAERARRFLREKGGNAALLFGLALVPVVGIVGLGVDYGRAMTVRSTMSDAADSAALAIGSWVGLTDKELETKAKQFFNANYASSLSKNINSKFEVSVVEDNLVVRATASVPTTFLRLAGINNLDVGIENTIVKRQRNIELALVLDVTGSMNSSGKLNAMKTAANKMIGDLFGSKSTSDTLDVAVVPFAAAVNVGTVNKDADWLDVNAKSTVAKEDFVSGVKPFTFFDQLKTVRSSWDWQGCVRERHGTAYELTDATPSVSVPNSLFAPYLAPDEPDWDHDDGDSYGNNYIDDDDCGEPDKNKRTPEMCQMYTAKYNSPTRTFRGSGPNMYCPPAAITPLNNNKSTVTNAINALRANGTTNIPAGLLWGWRVLTPGAPFTEGKEHDEDKRLKAIVLLTDGANYVNRAYNHNGSGYGAFGYASKGRLGNKNGSKASKQLNVKTKAVCDSIKAQGIVIYTIGFRVNNSTKNLLKYCASAADMFFNSPSNSQLEAVFGEIAQGLTELRIVQ